MSGPAINITQGEPGLAVAELRTDPQDLAAELAAQVGREQGDQLLKLARAAAVTGAARQGSGTTEFRLSVVLVLAGLALTALGVYNAQPQLQAEGVDLLKFVGAGYALSRGLAKAGAAVAKKP